MSNWSHISTLACFLFPKFNILFNNKSLCWVWHYPNIVSSNLHQVYQLLIFTVWFFTAISVWLSDCWSDLQCILTNNVLLYMISGQGPVVMTEYTAMGSGQPGNIPLPLPDMSRPPPGFPPGSGYMQQPMQQPPPLMSLNVKAPMEMDLMPSMPYYDLPAGLMAPLVKVSSFGNCRYNFRSIASHTRFNQWTPRLWNITRPFGHHTCG